MHIYISYTEGRKSQCREKEHMKYIVVARMYMVSIGKRDVVEDRSIKKK